MKTNEKLQRDVQDAIKWEPLLNAAEVGVTAKDGIVTLTGTVNSYAKKMEAEHAVRNVGGVRAVIESIKVDYGTSLDTSDTEIANAILNSWKWRWEVPHDKVRAKVENGWVSLEGEVEWHYQKEAAKKAVENLDGVRGISNKISIRSNSIDALEKSSVQRALERSGSVDESDVIVKVSGNNVTLSGTVQSLYQKDEAARLAWNAPGVWSVDNELSVGYGLL